MTTHSLSAGALHADRIAKSFGGLKVFHDVSFTVPAGGLLGVIGPNGAGKTTMINIFSGRLGLTSGQVMLGGTRIDGRSTFEIAMMGRVRSFQHTAIFNGHSVETNLLSALRFSRRDRSVLERLSPLLDQFGLIDNWQRNAEVMPYGLQKMLGLTMALATQPNMLLLDEPAAGLEKSERANIDTYVKFAREEFGCGILLVEHDMEIIKRLCPSVIVLDGGRLIAEGPPTDVLSQPHVINAYLGGSDEEDSDVTH